MPNSVGSGIEPENLETIFKARPGDQISADRFSPDEEASLLEESNVEKAAANSLFSKGDFSSAIQGYLKALAVCPTYLDYEVAVLRSNIAACHLKLSEWNTAAESATEALDALDHLDPLANRSKSDVSQVEEIDEETASKIEALDRSGQSRDAVQKLRAKALLRRARAREAIGSWASLQGAEEDYKQLALMPNLASLDQKTVQSALRSLPMLLEEAKQKEIGDMMGKLKQLGNGILKPFGLSTDNFNFVKDESSGGYSMQFNQGQK